MTLTDALAAHADALERAGLDRDAVVGLLAELIDDAIDLRGPLGEAVDAVDDVPLLLAVDRGLDAICAWLRDALEVTPEERAARLARRAARRARREARRARRRGEE